jgi:hypothetical protein
MGLAENEVRSARSGLSGLLVAILDLVQGACRQLSVELLDLLRSRDPIFDDEIENV